MQVQLVARHDRPAELRFVDAEEIEKAGRLVERLARVGEDAADLRAERDGDAEAEADAGKILEVTPN